MNVSRLIFKARSKTLDIKSEKKWKYDDMLCSGCHTNEDSGEEIFVCKSFGENKENISYKWFYSDILVEQVGAGKLMLGKLKIRISLTEAIT